MNFYKDIHKLKFEPISQTLYSLYSVSCDFHCFLGSRGISFVIMTPPMMRQGKLWPFKIGKKARKFQCHFFIPMLRFSVQNLSKHKPSYLEYLKKCTYKYIAHTFDQSCIFCSFSTTQNFSSLRHQVRLSL